MAEPEMSAPPLALPDDAQGAWQAYTEMLSSKQAHFECLENLDQKYRDGGNRTLAEVARLEGLLATHSDCVKVFTAAQKSLLQANPEAHAAFISILSNANAHLGTPVGPQ